MARGRPRPERRPGRQSRDPVDVAFPGDDPFEDPDGGSAGVREPRRPKPPGPMSGAGAKPMPDQELVAVLPDPRYSLA